MPSSPTFACGSFSKQKCTLYLYELLITLGFISVTVTIFPTSHVAECSSTPPSHRDFAPDFTQKDSSPNDEIFRRGPSFSDQAIWKKTLYLPHKLTWSSEESYKTISALPLFPHMMKADNSTRRLRQRKREEPAKWWNIPASQNISMHNHVCLHVQKDVTPQALPWLNNMHST